MRLPAVLLAICLIVAACTTEVEVSGIEPQDPVLVELGAELYSSNCAGCHGQDLRGTEQGPSHLSEVYEPAHHGDGAFLAAVSRGSPQHHWNFGPMPPVPGLSAEDVEAIVAFVREQQRLEGFEEYPPE
ncbi:MAG: cytochrome c [Actinobacteria bacterium]|nr:MAG: cytochrome c [Actinomycetota bacterium]REK33571.1 MAG: cytochrome c [Actinomycetota bacterium]